MLRDMALDAIALLRLSASDLPEGAVVRTLSDGVLVRTRASFASEPDELAHALRRAVGDALDRHRDERGVLILPDVARPSGKTYESVVDEIGEGGTWISLDEDEEGAFEGGDLLATMMNAMSSPEMQSAIARARDAMAGAGGADPQRMMELARSMSAGMSPSVDADTEAEMKRMVEQHGAGEMPVDLGALMSDPAFQRMVDDVRTQLLSDPTKLAQLQEMFGALDGEDDDEDEGEGGDEKPS
ncbi:hypothetical protein DB32_005574 [Sandaracinus amylolyticus]|uniref:Uncharacterized protein n=2 Tax=Sandaracinus amylolyticus TaxID=927083 RepID=A0A0F6W627_9BACT|nr:hypothetical protein DB32_005574 [Sandaracinus amylolyticus]